MSIFPWSIPSAAPSFPTVMITGLLDTPGTLRLASLSLLSSNSQGSYNICENTLRTVSYASCYDLPLFLLFLGLILSFLAITCPSHVIGPLSPLVFIIASFHPLPQTSITHSHLLICTSSWFHHIPSCSICFVIVPDDSESLVYKPSTRYISP